MAYAGAAAEAEAVRAEAAKIMLADHDGDMEASLVRARALVHAHPGSVVAYRLLGELHYAAAVRAARGEGTPEERLAAAAPHVRVALESLTAARRLAPDCVDVAATLGDALAAARMYAEAEAEFRRAQSIPNPSDPALHNAAYGMYEGYEHERDPAFVAERVEEARERARASYARMTVEELVPAAVQRVLDAGKLLGAAEGRKRGKLVAESFPNLARAQYLQAYMDLEFVRSLDPAIDKRPFLRRTLAAAERLVRAFPKSPVIASFRAKILFVLGEYDAAERECRRALDMKEPDDPQLDCIPAGSISGENLGARLVSLACEFHELINKIVMMAADYWDSMSGERRHDSFLRVSSDVLQDEYRKVDPSCAFTMSDVRSFVNEHKSWKFWICPICDRKKFVDSGLLLSHMCGKHPRAVLPRLQSLLDQTLNSEASEEEDFLDGVNFCEDSAEQDMICLNKSSVVFKWLFYAPSSGVGAKPIAEVRAKKREKGCMLLEGIKEKMRTLPTDKSSAEFSEAFPRIQDLWHKFLKASMLDYRGVILELARSLLWRELKKCMTQDPQLADKWISATDIDAVFTTEAEPSHAEGDPETGDNKQPSQADGALMVSGDHKESKVCIEHGESSETPANNTELTDLANSVAESGKDLDATSDKLDIDPKISENNQESEVQVEAESSEATVTKMPDPATSVAESGNDLDVKLENLQIDPSSDSPVATSGAGSSGQTGQQD